MICATVQDGRQGVSGTSAPHYLRVQEHAVWSKVSLNRRKYTIDDEECIQSVKAMDSPLFSDDGFVEVFSTKVLCRWDSLKFVRYVSIDGLAALSTRLGQVGLS